MCQRLVRLLGLVVSIGLALGPSAPASAVTLYTYTGNPFTAINGAPYTTSDHLTVTMTLNSPIGDSQNNVSEVGPNLVALSMSDGVRTMDLNTPNLETVIASFYTDSLGKITDWEVELQLPPSPSSVFMFTATAKYGQINDLSSITSAPGGIIEASFVLGYWTPFPEPGTATLLATGLLAMAGLRRRRV